MKKMNSYDTASEAINALTKQGYTVDFRVQPEEECLVCHQHSLNLSPDEFEIDHIYRFEGDSDPADEMIVFAIASKKHQVKGIVVNAYGIYSDAVSSKIVSRLQQAAQHR